MFHFFSKFKYFDIPLLISSGLLLLIGLAVLYATSLSGSTMVVFYRQIIFAAVGIAAYLFFSFYGYQNLAKLHRFVYPLLIVVLLGILLFGRDIRGSSRWIEFGFLRFQPAEFAKVVLILGLSRWLYLKRGQINSWKSIALTLLYILIPAGLILLEPDLGSSIIIFGIWAGILFVSPISKKFITIIMLALVMATGLGWQFLLKDYQRQRVEVFLDPNLDPRGRGYNVHQAMIAVGNGQIFGRGLGKGLQSQLKFLPERQTDFIFASASEEIGFIGCLALLILYYVVLLRVLKIIRNARDDLSMYIASGVLFLLFGQIVINIGMNIGLLPVTGIPLPFMTQGGSSLWTVLIALGMVQNVARQSKSLRF